MSEVLQNMDSKPDYHRFKNWKHKGRDAEVENVILCDIK